MSAEPVVNYFSFYRAMVERGQKLNEIEDQMENMSNVAKDYAQNSARLKNMYKNKKWYQL